MSHVTRMLALLVTAALCTACGQKGPLFLPGNPSEIRTEVPAADDAAEDEDEPDEEQR